MKFQNKSQHRQSRSLYSGFGVGRPTWRLLEQQSEELPLRVSQQQYARQRQQHWLSGELFSPQHSLIASNGRSELADGNLSGVPQESLDLLL